jgi:hypothetical protein
MGQLFTRRLRDGADLMAEAADRIDDLEDRLLVIEHDLVACARELEEERRLRMAREGT